MGLDAEFCWCISQTRNGFLIKLWRKVRERGSSSHIVALQGDLEVEWTPTIELGEEDQAHENVTDIGAVLGLVEERILAVEDGLLQGARTQMILSSTEPDIRRNQTFTDERNAEDHTSLAILQI
jgi:hypothetical protein